MGLKTWSANKIDKIDRCIHILIYLPTIPFSAEYKDKNPYSSMQKPIDDNDNVNEWWVAHHHAEFGTELFLPLMHRHGY